MGDIDAVSRAIGELQARFEALARFIESSAQTTQETSLKVSAIKDDVDEMKPAVNRFRQWEQRAWTVAAVASLVGGFFSDRISSFVHGLFK